MPNSALGLRANCVGREIDVAVSAGVLSFHAATILRTDVKGERPPAGVRRRELVRTGVKDELPEGVSELKVALRLS